MSTPRKQLDELRQRMNAVRRSNQQVIDLSVLTDPEFDRFAEIHDRLFATRGMDPARPLAFDHSVLTDADSDFLESVEPKLRGTK